MSETIIYKSVVGSTMHGLRTTTSDEDVRYVAMPALRTIVSPFQNNKIKVRDSQGNDEESWDLTHFCKHLTSGNPTVYEVIRTDYYDKTLPLADKLRSLMPLAFDGRKILLAHVGYCDAQLKRYLRKALQERTDFSDDGLLSDFWEENQIRRIPKSVVAGYRVLAQAKQLLETGDFEPTVSKYSQELHDKLMSIKTMDATQITWKFVVEHHDGLENGIKELKKFYDKLPDWKKNKTPDLTGIENVLYEMYGI